MDTALSQKKWETLARTAIAFLEGSWTALKTSGTPADIFLKKSFRENHYLGSRDRHFITQAVFAFYRWSGWIEKAFPNREPLTDCVLSAFAAEGICPPVWDLWCPDPEKKERVFSFTAPEERFSAFTGTTVRPADLLPAWTLDLLAPGAAEKYLPYLQSRPPVWIRVQKEREECFRELEKNGIGYTGDPRLPDAFRLSGHAKINLQLLDSFRRGRFEIQDFSSQCIGAACQTEPGQHWWDACAGGGGKTLFLASHGAKVTACDVREKKMEELFRRGERGGFRNIRVKTWSAALNGIYDGVLVDAPCSSSGRWRRNPEMKLAATKEWVDELCRTQNEILDTVCRCVRAGGFLVYGTCSVFACENTGTSERFLIAHPDFEPYEFSFGESRQWNLQSFPADADCDGGFRAVFRRKE